MRAIAMVLVLFCCLAACANELNIPLRISEQARVDRKAGPVTGGVPLPVGAVRDLSKLRVVDAAGRTVPAQFAVMERWWKPAYDNSVRWLKVECPWMFIDYNTGRTSSGRNRQPPSS